MGFYASEPLANEESIEVVTKNIAIDCTDLEGKDDLGGKIKADSFGVSEIQWKIDPPLSALPDGFSYHFMKGVPVENSVIKIDAKLNFEQCKPLLNKPVAIEVKACDAEDGWPCDTGVFTISAKMPDLPDGFINVRRNARIEIQNQIPLNLKKIVKETQEDINNLIETKEEEETAEKCNIKVELEGSKPKINGNYLYGDTIQYRLKDVNDKYNVPELESQVLFDGSNDFLNKTWRLIDDPDHPNDKLLIGALVYWNTEKTKIYLNKKSAFPFAETVTLTLNPLGSGVCYDLPTQTIPILITVNLPFLDQITLSDMKIISVMLYNQCLDGAGDEDDSQFWLRFANDDKDTIAETLVVHLVEDEDEDAHIKYNMELDYLYGGTGTLLSNIGIIGIVYKDWEQNCDWQANLDNIHLGDGKIFLYIGDGVDFHTQVDGGWGGYNDWVWEKEFFDLKEDYPWQLRCDPELPKEYDILSKIYKFDLPPPSKSITCGEEIGDDKNKCNMTVDSNGPC